MIRVVWCPNPVDPRESHKSVVDFREGMTLIDALPVGAHALKELIYVRNGEECERDTPLRDGDCVQGQACAGDVTIGVQIAIVIATQLLARALAPDVEVAKERDDDKSPTYGFRGIKSNRTDGEVKPIIYGRVRVAGQVINEFIESRAEPGTDLYGFQISFGYGPIKSLGGFTVDTPPDAPLDSTRPGSEPGGLFFFDDQPAEVFKDVQLHIRLGTISQDPVDGFEYAQQTFEVNRPLTSGETEALTTNSYRTTDPDGFPDAADDALIWDVDGIEFDLNQDEFDAATFTISFPQGLVRTNGASLSLAYFAAMIRYKALDDGGVPINVGGNFGDGWVRERARPIFADNKRGAFSLNFLTDLFDPDGYSAVERGTAMRLASNNEGYLRVLSSEMGNFPFQWDTDEEYDEISFECWFRLDPGAAGNTYAVQDGATLIQHTDTVGPPEQRGFRFKLSRRTFTTGPGTTLDRIVPVVTFIGQAAATADETYENSVLGGLGLPSFVPSEGQWTHVAFTYKRNVDGTKDRVRIYGNGHMIYERVDNIGAISPGAVNQIALGRDTRTVGPLGGFPGRIDEARLWHSERAPGQINASYNYGRGTYGSAAQVSEGLLAGWHFNGAFVSEFLEDYSGNGFTLNRTDVVAQLEGLVEIPSTTNKRRTGKWRVAIARANLESVATTVSDETEVSVVAGLIDEKFRYPGEPVLSGRIRASEQLSDTIPDVSAVAEGKIVRVWDEQNAKRPTFRKEYSQNPAWVASDIVLEGEYGMSRFGITIDPSSALEMAEHCNELIYDLKDRRVSDDEDAVVGWTNIFYHTTWPGFEGRGRLVVQFGASGPPEHWKVGGHVGMTGVNVLPGKVDMNQELGGYEIGLIVDVNATNRQVWLYWDRLDEGEPMGDTQDLLTQTGGGPLTGTVEGREVRFRYDGVFDREERLWDSLVQVCSTARTVPLRDGDTVRFKVSRPRPPVSFVCNANIEKDSFQVDYGDKKQLPNQLTIDFLDEDFNWDRLPAVIKHPVVQNADDTVAIVEENRFLRGVTRRSQVLRAGLWELNINQTLKRSGSFVSGRTLMHLDPGDVFPISHDLMPWGDGGKILARNATDGFGRIHLDRSVTFEVGKTYSVRVRNNAPGKDAPDSEVVAVDVAATGGVGTYAANSVIHLDTDLSFRPNKGYDYLFFEDGKERQGEVVSARLTDDMKVEFRWQEYDESIYEDTPTEDANIVSLNSTAADFRDKRNPRNNPWFESANQPVQLSVSQDPTVGAADGADVESSRVAVLVSWQFPDRVSSAVTVWVRELDNSGDQNALERWNVAGKASPGVNSITYSPDGINHGRSLQFAVQPTSADGRQGKAIDYCSKVGITISSVTGVPDPPSDFAVAWIEGKAIYSWTLPSRGLSVEARFGGWIIGQPAFQSRPGETSTEPIDSWGVGKLYMRCRDKEGRYSEAVVLDVTAVDVARRTDLVELSNQSLDWKGFGDGWTLDTPGGDPNTTLTGLARNASGELVFDDPADLVGTFLSVDPVAARVDSSRTLRPRPVYLSAVCEAMQIHPLTFDESIWSFNNPAAARASFEGPTWNTPDDPQGVSLLVEIRISSNGTPSGWSSWRRFRPGIVQAVAVQWRITVTRPDATWDVRLESFITEVAARETTLYDRTRSSLLLEKGILIRG